MIRVLFVCLGNICRSPMAEAVFRDMLQKERLEGKVMVDSAGTGDWHIGHPPHEGTRNLLTAKNISFEGLQARQVHNGDFSSFDYIIAMDAKNVSDLAGFGAAGEGTYVGRLSDFVPNSEWENVPDPYFTGDFDETYELITNGCKYLLSSIKKDKLV